MRFKLKKIIIEIKYSLIILIFFTIFSSFIRHSLYYYFECYLFIMFHEFSHIFIASLFRYKCSKIEFSICGMCGNISLGKNKFKNIIIFLAGPVSNIILCILFFSNHFIFKINIVLAIINLLPVYPLDGYRIFKELKLNLKYIEYIIYLSIFFIFIYTKNISVIIFLVYIIFIKINMKDNRYNC